MLTFLQRYPRCALLAMIVTLLSICHLPPCAAQLPPDAFAYKGWDLRSLEVRGLPDPLAGELKKGLKLAGQFKLYRRVYPDYYPRLLEDDLHRAALFLAQRGYPRAIIRPRFAPDPIKQHLRLTLEVIPGEPVRIDSLFAVGWPADPQLGALSWDHLAAGDILSEVRLNRTKSGLETALRRAGYAHAAVWPVAVPRDSLRAAVHWEVSAGPVYTLERVRVTGVAPDLVELAQRSVNIRAGDLYSPEALARAQENLQMLGLFRRVRIATPEIGPTELEVHADLSPRPHQSIEFNVGYWTDEFLRTHVRYVHRNLLRRGRGGEVGVSYSRFNQSLGSALWWPGLFGVRTRVLLKGDLERQDEKAYELTSQRIELAATYRPGPLTSMRGGLSVSDVAVESKTEDPGAFVERGGLLTVLSGVWMRDRSNDRADPTKGTVTWISAEWGPAGMLSQSHFIRGEATFKFYQRLGSPLVGAARLDVGLATPLGGSVDLLPNKRFYAGGARSMRGYERRALGPRDAEGGALGGEAKLEASVEIRFPLLWRFRGAFFIDTGQVWREVRNVIGRDLALAVGPGLMVRTPVGPLRGDVGFLLTEPSGDQPEAVIHLAVGHPY